MYVAVTRVQAPKQALERMAEGFRKAASDMRNVPGCLGLEIWLNDTTLEAVSRWESQEAVQQYATSPLFTSHHGSVAGASPHGGQSPHGGEGQGPQGGGGPGGQVEYFESETLI